MPESETYIHIRIETFAGGGIKSISKKFMNPISPGRTIKVSFTSLFFSLLFLLILPVPTPQEVVTDFLISATGEKNEQAKASEVWIARNDAERMQADLDALPPGWEMREGTLVSFRNQPASIRAYRSDGVSQFVSFSKSEYAGIVELRYGKTVHRVDLYSPVSGVERVNLGDYQHTRRPFYKNIGFYSIWFGAAFIVFFVLISLLSRKPLQTAHSTDGGGIRWNLWLMLPGLVVYSLVLAAYWPAQMSPDSIDQWRQVVLGGYNDAHPVLSTLFYKLGYLAYPGPQAAVILQMLLFLLATSIFLRECLIWGASRFVVFAGAVVLAIFPANYMIVTTLWKDVPFAAALILLTAFSAREVRRNLTFRLDSVLWISLASALLVGMRHNGIVIVCVVFALFFILARNIAARRNLGIALVLQIGLFIGMKTILLTALGANPIAPQYRAINAIHVVGAMEVAQVQWENQDREFLNQFLSPQQWREGYQCTTVVPLFWHAAIRNKWDFLGESTSRLNSIALAGIRNHPLVFLRHQACVTGLIWRIEGNVGEWLSVAPAEITDIPERVELGLRENSLLPEFKTWMAVANNIIFQSKPYTRPALYLLIGMLAACAVAINYGAKSMLITVPSLVNLLGMSLLMGAQDYRYIWPSVVVSLLILIMALGLAASSLRKK